MFRTLSLAITCGAVLFAVSPLSTQDYVPDVLELDGKTTLEFPADARMDLVGGATIEFWVTPDWTEDPGYDPVILSNAGPGGASYLVVLLRDRDGIGILSGDRFELVPHDFTDGELHHVAIVDYGDSVLVLVDNEPAADIDMTFQNLPSSGFWIGTSDGQNGGFVGAIAGLRIWDIPVAPEDLSAYSMVDIVNDDQNIHPDLEWLIGVSDFENQSFLLQDYAN